MSTSKAAFRLNGQPFGRALVADVACILDEAGIPNVLWGNLLLTVYGVPSIVDGAAFVVPDELASKATLTLTKAGFAACSQLESCIVTAGPRASPGPSAHVHVDQDTCISFYKKSQTLWRLSSLQISTEELNSGVDILLASDPRLPRPRLGRGRGAFPHSLYPVQVPSAHRLTEAFILLMLQDRLHKYEFFWVAMLSYILEYVDGDGLLDADRLEPSHRQFFRALQTGEVPIVELLNALEANSIVPTVTARTKHANLHLATLLLGLRTS